jgi:hypothetical protein
MGPTPPRTREVGGLGRSSPTLWCESPAIEGGLQGAAYAWPMSYSRAAPHPSTRAAPWGSAAALDTAAPATRLDGTLVLQDFRTWTGPPTPEREAAWKAWARAVEAAGGVVQLLGWTEDHVELEFACSMQAAVTLARSDRTYSLRQVAIACGEAAISWGWTVQQWYAALRKLAVLPQAQAPRTRTPRPSARPATRRPATRGHGRPAPSPRQRRVA